MATGVYDVSATVSGASKISVALSHKTVNDTCSSSRGFCVGPVESYSLENELGLLTTLGKANFI